MCNPDADRLVNTNQLKHVCEFNLPRLRDIPMFEFRDPSTYFVNFATLVAHKNGLVTDFEMATRRRDMC